MRAFLAGVVGVILAFGLAELVHDPYDIVPSVFVAIARQKAQHHHGDDHGRAASGGS